MIQMKDSYFARLTRQLLVAQDKQRITQTIVDAPFSDPVEAARLGLGIVVLLVVDQKTGIIHRVALSNTELAKGTTVMSVKKFEDIEVPVDAPDNIIARCIRTGKPEGTADWHYLFTPALTAEEARLNQAAGAIAYSEVHPLVIKGHRCGALIFSYFQHPNGADSVQGQFMRFYTQQVSQRLCDYL